MEVQGIQIDAQLLLALWGAILSSILSFCKIIEYWGNRFKIQISWIFRGDIEMGHDISITNLSSKPILLEYMEIFSKKGIWPFVHENYFWSPEDYWLNAKIEPSDTKVYNFSESDYFGWKTKDTYVRLYFAGKKTITKKIQN